MKITLSFHAKQRLKERKVPLESVKDTVSMPDYTVSKENKTEAYRKFKERTLKVVYSKEDSYIKVITLMWK